jgi:vacuolar-type H+-ATPase subunit E/Vma4
MTAQQQQEALAPVRAALLAEARAEAERALSAAHLDADATLARARAEARSILDLAADEGRADAARSIAAEHEKARRAARALELAAQRESYEELHRRVAAAVAHAFSEPGRRDQLVAAIRAELGADAIVRDAPGGGVRGEAAGRFVDLGVRAVTGRAVDALGDEVQALWAP